MKITKPIFTLRTFCPICGQGDSLIFYTCPKCKAIIIVCAEESSIFPNANSISKETALQASPEITPCPGCGQVPIVKFDFSTGEDIQKAGFSTDEYK
jgi:hypothetical protein